MVACCIEEDIIFDWLDFHLMQGVDKFFLADNSKNVTALPTLLADYVAAGKVEILPFPYYHGVNECLMPGKPCHSEKKETVNRFIHIQRYGLMYLWDNLKERTHFHTRVDVDEFVMAPNRVCLAKQVEYFWKQKRTDIMINERLFFGPSSQLDLDPHDGPPIESVKYGWGRVLSFAEQPQAPPGSTTMEKYSHHTCQISELYDEERQCRIVASAVKSIVRNAALDAEFDFVHLPRCLEQEGNNPVCSHLQGSWDSSQPGAEAGGSVCHSAETLVNFITHPRDSLIPSSDAIFQVHMLQ